MASTVQRLASGGIRVVPATARTEAVRRHVANLSGTISPRRRPHKGLVGSILKGIGQFGAGLVPGARTFIDAVVPITQRFAGGPAPCPVGFERNAAGQCVGTSFLDRVQRFLPGGETGTLEDVRGDAVMGAFGLPALIPERVGSITTRSGETRPILRCNRGMVLGTDNLCYPKAILTPRSRFRKHRRPIAPPISRRDVKAIRTAAGAKDRVAELAKDVGLHVSKTGHKRAKKAKG